MDGDLVLPSSARPARQQEDRATPIGKRVSHYLLFEVVGQGTYGRVKRAVDTRDGETYAVKIVKKSFLKRQRHFDEARGAFSNAYENVLREVAIMKKLWHPNIVRLHEIIDDLEKDKMYIVLQYVRGGAVTRRLVPSTGPGQQKGGCLDEDEARKCMRDVVRGLEYLHFQNVIHRDIKPENILFDDERGVYLICDFGVSLLCYDDAIEDVCSGGTPAYSAPEVMRRGTHPYSGRAADVWALGVTLYQLLSGRLLFEAGSYEELASQICDEPIVVGEQLPPAAKSLVLRMLDRDPQRRVQVADILRDEWITEEGRHPLHRLQSARVEISDLEICTAFVELDRSVHLVRARLPAAAARPGLIPCCACLAETLP